MAFQLRAQAEDRQSIELPPYEFVQSMQNAEPNRGAAAEPTAARNCFLCRTRKCKTSPLRSLEKQIGCARDDFLLTLFATANPSFGGSIFGAINRHRIVNPQGNTKAIEARA